MRAGALGADSPNEQATPAPGGPAPGAGRAALRRAAAGTVAEIAARLRDPEAVVAATVAGGTHVEIDNERSPLWEPGSLNRGYPALVLLYAELGRSARQQGGDRDRERDLHRATAHRYLELGAEATRSLPVQGAFAGLGALASAVRVAAAYEGEYASLLRGTDARMADSAHRLAALHASTREAGLPTYPAVVDVLSGLSGIGRYLLHRRTEAGDAALRAALTSLASLRTPLRVEGVEVPGWWYGSTSRTMVSEEFADGQANFGLGHGVPGPLGLLSLAWSEGVRVPGQDEAIATMAEWLLRRRERDEAGPYWTPYVPLRYYADRDGHPPPLPARPSWCYGAAGTARALVMAGRALGRPEWTRAGVEAVTAMLRRPADGWGIHDHAMCHGWSSMLYLLKLFELEHPEAGLHTATDEVAERLLRGYVPESPFGYRYYQPAADLYLDMPGFLDGAAGIALSLHAYATDSLPASGWDTLLLLN
ncbi:lanthionine synthetase C family protein [Streptomyces sp. 891-h]|uniref:lanthionine synthetase C family protein n=1 Tax=Streptomyces sp. 891-h TaxID=2720714 RepID=UPI001FA9E1EA|nr:lanthionine synthetase C family protein [Streptomyces sp. 891-h]UNZ21267.1 lanthionine synthetase C family protein [Streptomyces sp. 891-h]